MEAQQRLLCETETRLGEFEIHKTSMLNDFGVISGISGSVLHEFLFCIGLGGFFKIITSKTFVANILIRRDFLFAPSMFTGAALSG